MRAETPELFGNRDTKNPLIQQCLTRCTIVTFPFTTPDGYRITYFAAPKDVDQFDIVALYKVILMIADIRMIEDEFIRGDIFIFNSEGVSGKIVTKVMTPLTKKMLTAAQEAFPQRLASIHVINTNVFGEKTLNFFKMFVKATMKNRMS
ncbi:uncharacterized protein LOC103517155 [Diaphorina citri]|uniref:Uncharacterized protein LOC103517155 n=1 Tax=Diaphorina citri TaxID=121845 RepID=A0A1S3DF56_DIACI|nr:uncharacterized protein LOC103517155 [Diaphorina citri]